MHCAFKLTSTEKNLISCVCVHICACLIKTVIYNVEIHVISSIIGEVYGFIIPVIILKLPNTSFKHNLK